MNILRIKRIYENAEKSDGIRILVDRLWPRGVSKEPAHLDYWWKDIAPSTDLREWFGHKAENFKEFSIKYRQELKSQKEKLLEIKEMLKHHNVTLIYAAKDPKINHAIVLKSVIEKL